MSDVDDELLALVGNGSSSSRSVSPAGPRRKRRRNAGRHDDSDGEVQSDDLDAEGSDEEGEGDNEPVNPFRLEGIYKDDRDRERLLEMPELEREAELAARRDLIVQRRQKADLKAMVRKQQMAGRKTQRSAKPSKRKTRKLKKASSAPRRRRKADSEEEEDIDEEDEDDDDEEEEEEEESDYESTRKGSRSRKAVGKTSSKAAQLQKLKKSRAKVQRRKQGGDSDEESTAEESESEYDAEEAEALWRRKKERERREHGDGPKREAKASREQERIANKQPWKKPTLNDVNAARIRRDHFTRLVHRPDWTSQLIGKFARINYTQRDKATGRSQTSYRLVQVLDCHPSEEYYEVADQYTNVVCNMQWGEEKLRDVPLVFVSNSPVTEQEYAEWETRVERFGSKIHRNVPSREATQDQAEDLESYINRPFTEQDINQMLNEKKQAREAFQKGQRQKQRRPQQQAANGSDATQAGYNEVLMAQMNEKHRKADRERIAEAERRIALQAKLAAQRLASQSNTPVGTPPPAKALNGSIPASPAVKPVRPGSNEHAPASIALAAADLDVDLGDF